MDRLTRRQIIQDLKERLNQFERGNSADKGIALPVGTAFDALLPDDGLAWGSLIECLHEEGSGAADLMLRMASQVLPAGGALVVIDERGQFYPPAAAGIGIALEHTVLVRPAHSRDAVWAMEQALRSRAAAVVLAWAGSLHDRIYRRLKLAAEAGACVGLLLRPIACRDEPSWADVRLRVNAAPSPQQALGRRLRVEIMQVRGGPSRPTVELELCDETNHVRLVPRLADPTASRRRTAG